MPSLTMPLPAGPWNDRAGRFSPIRAVALAAALLPGLWIAAALAGNDLGPRPLAAATHETGLWAIRFFLASLAVTPLRRAGILPRLIVVRRLLGVTALAYALAHLALYVADMGFDLAKVATEIALRSYLTIGFVALLVLVALGATSTDRAIRAMGRGWHRLHGLAYPAALLGLWHYALQLKLDAGEAILLTGVFAALMGARAAAAAGLPLASPLVLLGLAGLSGLATAGIEAAWYAATGGVDPWSVLGANLDFAWRIAPAWHVAGSVAAVALLALLRAAAPRLRALAG